MLILFAEIIGWKIIHSFIWISVLDVTQLARWNRIRKFIKLAVWCTWHCNPFCVYIKSKINPCWNLLNKTHSCHYLLSGIFMAELASIKTAFSSWTCKFWLWKSKGWIWNSLRKNTSLTLFLFVKGIFQSSIYVAWINIEHINLLKLFPYFVKYFSWILKQVFPYFVLVCSL